MQFESFYWLGHHGLYKQRSPFGAKICSDICPRTLSVPRSEQSSESEALKLEENCELRGTDNVQGQISEHIFAPTGDYCLYYPSNLFRNARSFENWGIFNNYSMSARWT